MYSATSNHKVIDCLLIGHYAMKIERQIQLAEMAFGKDSSYYFDALEKKFIYYEGKKYTSSQLYNLFYNKEQGDLSFDHVTFEHSFNTAIANVGTFLVRKGHTIDFVNTFNTGRKTLPATFTDNEVLTVAIPTTFYISAFPIAQIVSFVRKYSKTARIIVGGPFVKNLVSTYKDSPEELDRMFRRMRADYYVCSSEGEATLSRIVDAVKQKQPVEELPNLYFEKEGKFQFTFDKAENNPFTERGTDWSFFNHRVPELVNIRTTHSCPFDCAFCGLPVAGGKWLRLPTSEIELELQSLAKARNGQGKPGIFFIDETLNFPTVRFKEMLQMMIRNNFQYKWEAELRCDTLDEETVQLMKKSGCQLVHLGIESGNQQVLDNMTKRVDLKNYYKAMELLHKYEIMTSALILVGFPGETEATFQDTFDFIEQCKPTFFRVHRWFYDHETPVNQKREEYELSGGGYNWKHSTMDSVKAHELSTALSLGIKNSIHTDDYSMAFYLVNKGYNREKVKNYLQLFDWAVKEKCSPEPSNSKIDALVDQMKTALN